MCGIVGFIAKEQFNFIPILDDMIDSINHRGPDDKGVWVDHKNSVGLGHARLSILDLSTAGRQPMNSKSSRFTIVFNGEIYNHKSLRKELNKCGVLDWKGRSDTEVLLMALEMWGIDLTLEKINGMFAFAVWDKQQKTLSIARDRMGEKPVYYGHINGNFVFGSELKALKKFPRFNNSIDRDSLSLFLRYSSVPAPHTIYKDIYKLEPGCYVSISPDNNIIENQYWSTERLINKKYKSQFSGSENDAVNQLERLLLDAVGLQTQADVPLGAFLSGGVDSSTVVALMQAQSNHKINTFSIGFENSIYNEADYARSVAKYIGTQHYDLYVTDKDALNTIPFLPEIYDEPFADASQIPTYLVSKIAREKVTVSLSGDAGDELFGGYNRYVMTNDMWSKISRIPLWMRAIIQKGIKHTSPDLLNMLLNGSFNKKYSNIGDKFHKGADVLLSKNIQQLYLGLISQIKQPEKWVINANEYKTPLSDKVGLFNNISPIEGMMAYDLIGYLPNDILTKVDRASMAVSLETRIPFLDYRVVEFSASLPVNYKIRNGVSKWILREVLYKYVPKELIERPKMGFGVPLGDWLRGPLREWAEILLDGNRLKNEGFFNPIIVHQNWQDHISGKRNLEHQLWNVLMFQSWLERQSK